MNATPTFISSLRESAATSKRDHGIDHCHADDVTIAELKLPLHAVAAVSFEAEAATR